MLPIDGQRDIRICYLAAEHLLSIGFFSALSKVRVPNSNSLIVPFNPSRNRSSTDADRKFPPRPQRVFASAHTNQSDGANCDCCGQVETLRLPIRRRLYHHTPPPKVGRNQGARNGRPRKCRDRQIVINYHHLRKAQFRRNGAFSWRLRSRSICYEMLSFPIT